MAFNWDLEEEEFCIARGFSTVFRRSGGGVVGLVQDCKFLGVGSISGCSTVENRAAGMVFWSLYVSTIGVGVTT
jgi:hypothetical protein